MHNLTELVENNWAEGVETEKLVRVLWSDGVFDH
jgi:hypothetical protein